MCIRACEQQLEKCSVRLYKNDFLQLVDDCRPYLLLCSAYFAAPALSDCFLSVSRSVLLHRNWPVDHYVNVCYILTEIPSNSQRSLFLVKL